MRRRRATGPIAPVPAHATGLATAPAQSMHRCRQRLPRFGGSRLVVNAIVIERAAFRLAIPDCNWTIGRRHQHDFTHRLPDERSNAAPRSCSHLAQCVELLFPQINLSLFHMCQFSNATDTCQLPLELGSFGNPSRTTFCWEDIRRTQPDYRRALKRIENLMTAKPVLIGATDFRLFCASILSEGGESDGCKFIAVHRCSAHPPFPSITRLPPFKRRLRQLVISSPLRR